MKLEYKSTPQFLYIYFLNAYIKIKYIFYIICESVQFINQ